MAQHSSFNTQFKGKIACGLPLIPFKTSIEGPGKQNYSNEKIDIIDEAFDFYRINVLFKNYQIRGGADRAIVYLSVLISYLFKITENIKEEGQAKKRLIDVTSGQVQLPKQKGNFMSMILSDGNGMERDAYVQYIRHLRAQTVSRFITKFYKDGVVHEDFKFWVGLSKKKFMGLNYISMF